MAINRPKGSNHYGIPPAVMTRCQKAADRGNASAMAVIKIAEMAHNRGATVGLIESGGIWSFCLKSYPDLQKRGEG